MTKKMRKRILKLLNCACTAVILSFTFCILTVVAYAGNFTILNAGVSNSTGVEFDNWTKTVDWINTHGSADSDYTVRINSDVTIFNNMKFPVAKK